LKKRGDLFFPLLAEKGVKQIYLPAFADDWLKQDIEKAAKETNCKLHFFLFIKEKS